MYLFDVLFYLVNQTIVADIRMTNIFVGYQNILQSVAAKGNATILFIERSISCNKSIAALALQSSEVI